MKRVRCPKCERYIIFDETRYNNGQNLVFECPDCGKHINVFGESHTEQVAEEYGLKLLAQIPIDPKIAQMVDGGQV